MSDDLGAQPDPDEPEREPVTDAAPTEVAGAPAGAPVLGMSTRRPGCLLAAVTAALGALAGALVAGLILLVVLSGDDSAPTSAASTTASAPSTQSASNDDTAEVAAAGSVDVPPEGASTADASFWSQVFANYDFFNPAPAGDGSATGNIPESTADSSFEIDTARFNEYWAQLLTGEGIEPGSPLGSRIEGINVKAVLEAVQESVVIVKVTSDDGDGGGSGFIVTPQGRIVTNAHVVQDADRVDVRFFGGELVRAQVMAVDPARDLAVLQVDRDGLVPVRLGSTDGVEVGDEVIAIGNALDIIGEPTVTSGIVSGLNRSIELEDETRLVRLIQTDAAINPGNSGGPLVNAAGEVIGVNTAIAGGFAEGIGYAISIDHARPIIDLLLEGVVQSKAYLGVRIMSVEDFIASREVPDESDDPGPGGGLGDSGPETVEPGPDPDDELSDLEVAPQVTYGALVVGIDPGEAADRAGIVPGDVIIEFEGGEIRTSNDLVVEILARLPGDRVEMKVIGNDGTVRTVALELGSFEPELES